MGVRVDKGFSTHVVALCLHVCAKEVNKGVRGAKDAKRPRGQYGRHEQWRTCPIAPLQNDFLPAAKRKRFQLEIAKFAHGIGCEGRWKRALRDKQIHSGCIH